MSQCADILAVLADGEWHTVADIHRRAGFSRLNSRVSELRDRGHHIECDRVAAERASDAYRYRLRGSLDETSAISLPPGGTDGGRRLVERTQSPRGALALIEQPDGQLAIEVAA